MIALLDNGQDLATCAAELSCEVGQLLTPLTRYHLREPERPWAIDNGGYSGLDIKAFRYLLEREAHRQSNCLFVVVPDIVGSARRTLELFDHWAPQLTGWRLAFACQDGQEHLPIPWTEINAVFIGGSTNFKCGESAAQIIRTAKAKEKWVHVGRVNHGERWEHFKKLGADSADGSGIARYTHAREAIANRNNQGVLV
jgi:hypothetical protein